MIKLWNKGNGKRIFAFVLCMALALETADIRAMAAGNADPEKAAEETHPEEQESTSGNGLADAFPGTVDGMEIDDIEVDGMEYDAVTDDVQTVNADGLIASGEEYGLVWSIDADGVLTIAGNARQTESYTPAWLQYATSIKAVKITAKNVQYTYCWFYNCVNLKSVDFSQFNTSKVKNMSCMFYGCSGLESLDLSGFDTRNVTSMSNMFAYCNGLKSMDLSGFDTHNVTSMNHMFAYCKGLKSLDLNNFSTGNVSDLAFMFYFCSGLESLNVGSFSTENVTDMSSMFSYCSSLKSLDLSSFYTRNVTDMRLMFRGCNSLEEIDLHNFDTQNVTNMESMFEYCSSLKKLDLSSFNTEKVTDMRWIFEDCSNLEILDIHNFTVCSDIELYGMFWNCRSLTGLDLSGFDLSSIREDLDIGHCSSLEWIMTPLNLEYTISLPTTMQDETGTKYQSLPLKKDTSIKLIRPFWDPDKESISGIYRGMNWEINRDGMLTISGEYQDRYDSGETSWHEYSHRITKAKVTAVNVTSTAYWFSDCNKLVSVDFEQFDTAQVTDMRGMFSECSSLASLDLRSFDTRNVTDMAYMFDNCSSLVSLDISGFDTRNVTDVLGMFSDCSSLASLDLSSFDTRNVTNMGGMFSGCSSLGSLNLSSFDTHNVTDMGWMFYNCSSLVSLDLSSFDTRNITDMKDLFKNCSSLASLDLSSFDTHNVTDMCEMFYGCSSLTSLNLSSFDTGNVERMDMMFEDCSSLISLDVSKFDTRNVKDMGGMFCNCSSLTSLDVSGFDTGNVTTMSAMFSWCNRLEFIDLSNLNTSKVTNVTTMFWQCSSLKNLDLSNMNLSAVQEQSQAMLNGCFALCQVNTPLYLERSITLPVNMCDENGKEYKTLPTGMARSVKLVRSSGTSGDVPVSPFSGLEITLAHGGQYDYTGRAVKPEVLVTENGRTLAEGSDYTVKYNNNVNASVVVKADGSLAIGADGQYLPVNAGKQPTVTVTVKGNYSGSQTVDFAILPVDLAGLYPSGLSLKAEEKSKPAITLMDGATRLAAKDYSLTKDGAAYTPAAVRAGETLELVATGKGNYRGNIAVTVTGAAPKSLHKLSVTPVKQFKGFEYNGKSQTPVFGGKEGAADVQVVVSSKTAPKTENGGEGLKEHVDYYVTYSPDTVNAGTVKYTVVGMGDYTGSVTKTYKINPVKASSGLTLSYDRDRQYAFDPAGSTVDGIRVTFLNAGSLQTTNEALNNTVLTPGKDYKITYSNHKKAGIGKFTVNFLGNYRGSAALKNNLFTIRRTSLGELAAQGRVRVALPDKTAKKSGVYKSAPIVTVDNVLLKSSNYTVSYYTNESLQTPMDKNGSELQLDAEHPFAQVWIKIEGKGNYGMIANDETSGLSELGGQKLSYRVYYPNAGTQGDLSRASISLTEKSYTYTGEEICPGKDKFHVVCKVGKESVTLDASQYDIVYLNNVNKGRATAVITGNGKGCEQNRYSFVGSKTMTFTITARKVK